MTVESSLVEIDLGPRAQGSPQAILWIRSDIEIGHGAEMTCTVRPRETFRPERFAVLAEYAGSLDLVDLKVAHCSAFANVWQPERRSLWECGAGIPAVRYATAYERRPRPAADAWVSGPHRAVVSDKTRLGLSIDSRVCPVWSDIVITVRHRQEAPPAALDVVIMGTVMSEAESTRPITDDLRRLRHA